MSTPLEAEIDIRGNVRLLEPVRLKKKSRAIVEIIEENDERGERGNVKAMLEFLRNNRLPESSRLSVEEIEAQIEENRNSWD